MLVVAASVPLTQLVSRLMDGAMLLRDSRGNLSWVAEGHRSRTVLVLALTLACISAIRALAESKHRLQGSLVLGAVIGLISWTAVAAGLRGGGLQDIGPVLVMALLSLGVALQPPTVRTLRHLAMVLTTITLSVGIFTALRPELATVPCRSDGKCGLTGALVMGYFPQENYLAILLILMLPTCLYLRTRAAQFACGLATVFWIFESGSRAAEGAVLILVPAMIWHARTRHRNAEHLPPRVFRALPLAAFALSGYVFFRFSGRSLTGRGEIYQAVRNELHGGNWFTGAGDRALLLAHEQGVTRGFQAAHEHGQFPHLINTAGLIGVVLFALMLASLMTGRGWRELQRFGLVMALPAAALFTTESVWQLHARSANAWSFLLLVGLLASRDLHDMPLSAGASTEEPAAASRLPPDPVARRVDRA